MQMVQLHAVWIRCRLQACLSMSLGNSGSLIFISFSANHGTLLNILIYTVFCTNYICTARRLYFSECSFLYVSFVCTAYCPRSTFVCKCIYAILCMYHAVPGSQDFFWPAGSVQSPLDQRNGPLLSSQGWWGSKWKIDWAVKNSWILSSVLLRGSSSSWSRSAHQKKS